MKCAECELDGGFCIYCQRQFKNADNLHKHLATQHQDTIRVMQCESQGGNT